MADKDLNITTKMSPVLQEIKSIQDTARSNVARQVNSEIGTLAVLSVNMNSLILQELITENRYLERCRKS